MIIFINIIRANLYDIYVECVMLSGFADFISSYKKCSVRVAVIVGACYALSGCKISAPIEANTPVSQPTADTKLSQQWDSQVLHGQLANGLRYYIHNSQRPQDPFNIRLLVNAGSVDETGHSGVAHMVEHMVFRQTAAHPEGLHQYFAKLGWSTGKQINAVTREDITQFMLRTRLNDVLDLPQSLALMADIAFGAQFNAADWQQEQRVILEEWRRGDSVADRIHRQKKEQLRNGSRYVGRPTIGNPDSIQSTSFEEIKAFYQQFYRASNMRIIISGNVDPQATLAALQASFGNAATQPPPSRDYVELPLQQQLHIGKVQEPTGTTSAVVFGWRSALPPMGTVARERDDLVRYFLRKLVRTQVLRDRALIDGKSLTLMLQQPTNARLVAAFVLRTKDHAEALPLMLQEAERLRRHGIDATEFAKLKQAARVILERQLQKTTAQRDYRQWEDAITNALVADKVLEAPAAKAKRRLALLETIEVASLQRRLSALLSSDDQFLYYQLPGDQQQQLPSVADIQALARQWQQADNSALARALPYQAAKPKPPKMATEVVSLPAITISTQGEINTFTQQAANGEVGQISQWLLDNGDRVVWLDKTTKNDQLYINVISDVGFDNAQQSPTLSQTAVQLWAQTPPMGWSEAQWQQLPQWKWVLQSQRLSVAAVVAPEQLPALLDSYRLQQQHGTIDAAGVVEVKQALQRSLARDIANAKQTPKLSSIIAAQQYPHEDKTQLLQSVKQLSAKQLQSIARAVLAEPVTYYMVGKLPNNAAELWQQKLAGIARHSQLTAAPQYQRALTTELEQALYQTNKAQVLLRGYRQFDWTPERAFDVAALAELTRNALKQRLRQQLAGIYGLDFSMQLDSYQDRVQVSVGFYCAPERRHELLNAAKQVLAELPQLMHQNQITPLKRNIAYAEKQRLAQPSTWLTRLILSERRYGDGRYLAHVSQLPERITLDHMQHLAQQLLPLEHSIVVMGYPKSEPRPAK